MLVPLGGFGLWRAFAVLTINSEDDKIAGAARPNLPNGSSIVR